MDLKDECERLFKICQGCLSSDRKISLLNVQDKVLFLKLRDEGKRHEDENQVHLCWECIALLNKMKKFQCRIKKAQYLLMQCLQTCYNKDLMQTLSNLKTKQTYQFSHEFSHEKTINTNLAEILPQKEEIQNDIETAIKQENDDIKEEYYSNYETDNFEPYDEEQEPKIETDFLNQKPIISKSQKSTQVSIKSYLKHVTITKCMASNGAFKKVDEFAELAFLTEKEIEEILGKDRRGFGYSRMPHKCKECKIGYRTLLDLQRHKTFHHNQCEYPTPCLACKKEIPTESDMETHWKDFHSSVLRCTLCSELYMSKELMKKHLKKSHSRTYTCNDCLQEFRNLREFSTHYRKVHERVVCDYCNKSYSYKRKLEHHIRRYHIPAYCPICNRSFTTYRSFEKHNKVYHPEQACDTRKELCYCVECDKQYPSVYTYKRHLQQSARHRPKKKVRVPCPDCNKVFSRTAYMNNHYRLIHMKESKHYCEICNKYFSNGYGLRKHIKVIHHKMALPKDKICDLCGRGFSTNRILTNHRRTHTGERPFKCKYCSATFAQETAMKTHQKTQHKSVIDLPPG